MNRQTGFIQLLILIIIAVVLGGAAGYAGVFEPGRTSADTADWKVYVDSYSLLEFKYPLNYSLREITPFQFELTDPQSGCSLTNDWTTGDPLSNVEFSQIKLGEITYEVTRTLNEAGEPVRITWSSFNKDKKSFGFYGYQGLSEPVSDACLDILERIIGTTVLHERLGTSPDAAIAWKTYSHPDYGYEVKYPADWAFQDYRSPGVQDLYKGVEFWPSEPEPFFTYLSIYGESRNVEQIRNTLTDPELGPVWTEHMVPFAERSAYEFLHRDEFGNNLRALYVPGDNPLFITVNRNIPVAEQILSTFKFTK